MPLYLVEGPDGAFYPVTVAEETSFLKPHDELPKEAIENWEQRQEANRQFQNAHWQRILEKLGAQ